MKKLLQLMNIVFPKKYQKYELVWVRKKGYYGNTWQARYFYEIEKGNLMGDYRCFNFQKKDEDGLTFWEEIRKFNNIPF